MVLLAFLLKSISSVVLAGFLTAASPAAEEVNTTPINRPSQGLEFELKFNNQIFEHDLTSAFVLPGEGITLEALGGGPGDAYELSSPAMQMRASQGKRWMGMAPLDPGVYPLNVKNLTQANAALVNVFVLVPFERAGAGTLNGYRIGQYPAGRWKNTPAYDRPKGFIEVTPENADTALSPHFKLKQFLCKQADGYPKYLILQPRLLQKLEAVMEELQREGLNPRTLHVMSGYRTPFYNKAIGNTTTFSRHNWGDAADVFVDDDRDGMMDDLNNDGRIDRSDAVFLQQVVERVVHKNGNKHLTGGLSAYRSSSAHGPFVHVDARGYAARW